MSSPTRIFFTVNIQCIIIVLLWLRIYYNTCNYTVLCAKPNIPPGLYFLDQEINSVCQTTFHSLDVWESGDETRYNTHINRHSLCTSTLINTHLLMYSQIQCQIHVENNYVVYCDTTFIHSINMFCLSQLFESTSTVLIIRLVSLLALSQNDIVIPQEHTVNKYTR